MGVLIGVSERPTLAGDIYPQLQKTVTSLKASDGTDFNPDEEAVAVAVLQAMIDKTLELFPLDKVGEVDKAGQAVLRKAIENKKITKDRAKALWAALFQNKPSLYKTIEMSLMQNACQASVTRKRPTLAQDIYPEMTKSLDTLQVKDAPLSLGEKDVAKAVLQAMIDKTLELFPLDKVGEVDKAGQAVLRKAIENKKITKDRAKALWAALFQNKPSAYATVEGLLMNAACPVPPTITATEPSPLALKQGETIEATLTVTNLPTDPNDVDIAILHNDAAASNVTASDIKIDQATGKVKLKLTAAPTAPADNQYKIKISRRSVPDLFAVAAFTVNRREIPPTPTPTPITADKTNKTDDKTVNPLNTEVTIGFGYIGGTQSPFPDSLQTGKLRLRVNPQLIGENGISKHDKLHLQGDFGVDLHYNADNSVGGNWWSGVNLTYDYDKLFTPELYFKYFGSNNDYPSPDPWYFSGRTHGVTAGLAWNAKGNRWSSRLSLQKTFQHQSIYKETLGFPFEGEGTFQGVREELSLYPYKELKLTFLVGLIRGLQVVPEVIQNLSVFSSSRQNWNGYEVGLKLSVMDRFYLEFLRTPKPDNITAMGLNRQDWWLLKVGTTTDVPPFCKSIEVGGGIEKNSNLSMFTIGCPIRGVPSFLDRLNPTIKIEGWNRNGEVGGGVGMQWSLSF